MFRKPNLALRSLASRPSRTILTSFGIVLGVAVILGIRITNVSTLDSLITLFTETSGKANLVVINSQLKDEGFYEGILYRIASFPGIKAAVPTLQAYTILGEDLAPGEFELNIMGAASQQLLLFGIDPELDQQVREYNLVAGELLSEDLNALEIVLVEDYADEKEVWVKDRIDIVTPDGPETLRIVGIISKDGAGQLNNGVFGVIPLETAQKMFNSEGKFDQIDILVEKNLSSGNELDSLKIDLEQKLGKDYSVIYPAMQGKRVTQMMDMLTLGLNFFSGIAIFVGIFLIYNAFSMTVVERTREFGMLRTLGMTRGQITRQVFIEALILGMIGSIGGILLGILMSRGLIRLMEVLFAQEVKDVIIPLDGLVLAISVGIVAALMAAIIPARQAGNISPLEALRIRGNSSEGWLIKRGWILGIGLIVFSVLIIQTNPFPDSMKELVAMGTIFPLFIGATLIIPVTVEVFERTIRPVVRFVYGNEGQIGSSNVRRAKIRTTLTVAALMVGVAMLLTLQALSLAFKNDINEWQEFYNGGDLFIFSNLPMRLVLAGKIESVEGVDIVSPIRYIDIKFTTPDGEKEDIVFSAIDPETHYQVTSFAFAANQGDKTELYNAIATRDAVFITTVLSEKYNLQQGDTIQLQTRSGQKDFEIAAIVTDFVENGNVIEGSWRVLRRYYGVNDASSFFVQIEPGYSVEEVMERIDVIHGKRNNLTIQSNEEVKEEGSKLLSQAFSMFDVVAIIGVIIASLGVINTLFMNVMERTQEIGMLRGVGMTRWQVAKMILAEAGMMGLIGGFYGLAFGIFLSRMLLTSLISLMGYDLIYVFPVQGIYIGLLISLIVSQIAAIFPGRRAAGINIVEAIQYE